MQNRFKSKVVWGCILAQILIILQVTGALQAMGLDAGVYNQVGASVLQLLVLVGVLNNPTDAKNF